MAAATPTLEEVNTLVTTTIALIGAQEIPGQTVRKGITDVPKEQQRFIPVLEALASLAVFKKDVQVVAVSVLASESDLIFTLAENKVVPTWVMDHIRELLGMLKTYSQAADDKTKADIKLEIVKITYMHSYGKLNERFKNRAIEILEIAFNDSINDLGASALVTGALEVISALTTSRAMLKEMSIKWYPTVKLPNKRKGNPKFLPALEVWVNLIAEIDQVNLDLDDVLKHELECDKWADKLKGKGGLPDTLALFRWIQKLSSHHRQINNLLRYAETPAGRKDLSVVDGPLCMKSVLANTPDPTTTGTVHSECALISNLHEEMLRNPIRPVNYIGVSKLSCAPCYAWIDAYNETAQVKFYTQGTHGRWYPGWTMSTVLQPDKLLERMMAIVALAKKTFEEGQDKRRILITDSTGAEGKLVPGAPPRTKVYLSKASRDARKPKL